MSIEDRIEDLEGLTSEYHKALLAALKAWQGKKMGNSGVYPQYVVKVFIEPKTQRKITRKPSRTLAIRPNARPVQRAPVRGDQ